MPMKSKYFIFLLPLISIFSCKSFDEIQNSNRKSNNYFNGCASITSGDDKKIVCGDSKDRVLEKLGQPDSVSPTHSQWRYGLCVIEFNEGTLKNYGGKCDLKQISNDSFTGDRLELDSKKLYESKSFLNTKKLKKHTNCLKIENGDSFSTMLSLMGEAKYLRRNVPKGYYCDSKQINRYSEYNQLCADTIAYYLFNNLSNYLSDYECKLYIKDRKIIYINDKCPVPCSLFD